MRAGNLQKAVLRRVRCDRARIGHYYINSSCVVIEHSIEAAVLPTLGSPVGPDGRGQVAKRG